MENNFDLDGFFNELQKDEEKKVTQKGNDRITKIYSRFAGDQGTVYFLPFNNLAGSPMVSLESVLTSKLTIDEKDYSVKILPKEFLSIVPGSPEDILYGELVSLHKNLFDKKGTNYGLAKFEKVYLMYAWVLCHFDNSSNVIREKLPALLVMSNRKFKEAFSLATKQMVGNLKSLNWTKDFYSRESERKNLVKVSFKLSGNEYNFSYNHEPITYLYHGMTDGKDVVSVDKSIIDTYFTDPVNDYMGCDKIEERFRYDFFLKVKAAMQEELNKLNGITLQSAAKIGNAPAQPIATGQAPVKNGQSFQTFTQMPPQPQQQAAPAQQPQQPHQQQQQSVFGDNQITPSEDSGLPF